MTTGDRGRVGDLHESRLLVPPAQAHECRGGVDAGVAIVSGIAFDRRRS